MQTVKLTDSEILDMPVWSEVERAYGYSIDDYDEKLYLWENAKMTYLNLRFPFDLSIDEVPVAERKRACNMIGKLILDYLERRGLTSATSYSENGLHWSFDSAGVSKTLVMQIKSSVGVV